MPTTSMVPSLVKLAAGDALDGVDAGDGFDLAVVDDLAAGDGGDVGQLQLGGGLDQHGALGADAVGQVVVVEHQGVDRRASASPAVGCRCRRLPTTSMRPSLVKLAAFLMVLMPTTDSISP